MIHPFIEKAMIEHARATSTEIFQIAQPNVMVTENQNLTVTDIELVVHENNRSNYRAHLGPKKSVALDRVGQWIDQWKGTIYGGTSTAAEIGTRVHNAINCILQGKAEAAAYQLEGGEDEHCFDLFLNWFQKNWFMKTLATEATVWHLGLGIAGTLDLLMANQQYDQQITLIDFKTTNNMVRKYPLQLYLYAFCLAKIGVNVGRAVIVSLPKPSQGNQWSELVLWDDRFPETMAKRNQLAAVCAHIACLRNSWDSIDQILRDEPPSDAAKLIEESSIFIDPKAKKKPRSKRPAQTAAAL